jgi:hypothetical protein
MIPLVITKIVLDENYNYHGPLLMIFFSKTELGLQHKKWSKFWEGDQD